jgi:general secretion pathway protein G
VALTLLLPVSTLSLEIDIMRQKEGFTLVEIMIVVSVVSLLASLASMMLLKSHRKALVGQTEAELNILSSSVLRMAWDTGRWPNTRLRTESGSTEIWDISSDSAGLMGSGDAYDNWQGPYYEGSVLDPWGHPYFFDPDYRVDGEMRVVVGSFGPNGNGRNLYDDDDIYVLLDD